MCFRPATADFSLTCTECGGTVNAVNGKTPSKCPFCKAEFGSDQAAAPGGAPQTPSAAPNAPATPSVPGAPGAPGHE